jgi:UDPglucose 6-dehydrogenase
MNKDGSCNTDIVSSVIKILKSTGMPPENIVVRSTVPVGFCEKHGVSFMPEFLTEANWEEDFKNSEWRIVGLQDPMCHDTQRKYQKLFMTARKHGKTNKEILHDTFCFCSTSEAEAAKLTRNCFLATKVSFFNEIEEFCREQKIDYKIVAALAAHDERIGDSHTLVPGPDGKHGFGGTCFPKDTNSMVFQMKSSVLLKAVVERNENVDRPEHDWELDKGRAVSN